MSKENFQSFIAVVSYQYENYISWNFDKINLNRETKNHLIYLCRKISSEKLSDLESIMLIGFVQGVLFQCGERTIDDLINENKEFADYSEFQLDHTIYSK